MACLLSLPSFAAEELQGQAHRSVMLQALCMVATAFQLSPMALPAQLTTELVGLVCALVEGAGTQRCVKHAEWCLGMLPQLSH